MAVLDLSAYKPVPATLGDANQIANGFQAIVNCINALDNNNFAAGKIFDPAKLMQNAAIDGDPLVFDNNLVKWVPASAMPAGRPRAPRMTISTMAGGPPGSPVDGDIWVATAVDANGVRWAFQYNAGSASASKWEFIGGPPARVEVLTDEIAGSTGGWVDLTTVGPSFTTARAGDYTVHFGVGECYSTGAAAQFIAGPAVAGGAPPDVVAYAMTPAANQSQSLNGNAAILGIAAASSIRLRYFAVTNLSQHLHLRWITVTPTRIT